MVRKELEMTSLLAENIESLQPQELLDAVLNTHPEKSACLTCSFQAEDMVALHMLRQRMASIPVLFLETGYHFAATYEYRDRIAKEWSLNLVNVLPQKTVEQQESEFGILYRSDPSRCCQLRKVEPLFAALESYEIWFTGLRREQSPTRRNLKKLEEHSLPSGKQLLKVSLLADWTWERVWTYTADNRISYLPQYDEGYLSIGCEPCTAIPADPANPRSGRWGGAKLECGIHTLTTRAGT
jgi:phosphoadenosine phosphosulfate reductase